MRELGLGMLELSPSSGRICHHSSANAARAEPEESERWAPERRLSPAKGIPPGLSVLTELLTPILGARAQRSATALLLRFGSVGQIMNASLEALQSSPGVDRAAATAINAARELTLSGVRETLRGRPVNPAEPDLHQYLITLLRGRHEEMFHAIFLTRQGLVIKDEAVSCGSASGVGIHLRTLLGRALDLGATKLIIAHNHPSGIARPSSADIDATRKLAKVAHALDLELLDHLIVGAGRIFSVRAEAFL